MEHMSKSRLICSGQASAGDGAETAATTTMRLPGACQPERATKDPVRKNERHSRQIQAVVRGEKKLDTDPNVDKSRC